MIEITLPPPSRFPANAPARNIHELLDDLRADDRSSSYLYRGQTKHYDNFVPSVYRKLVKPGATGPILNIDADAFHPSLDERRRLRFAAMNRLIRQLGKGVGNIVAQQYGLASEAIDVTSDIDIAAFFATRSYPAYDHFAGTADSPIGVIYRFPRAGVQPKHLDGLDNITDAMVVQSRGVQALVPFYRKRSDLPKEVETETDAAIDANGGPVTAQLATLPVVIDHVQFEALLAEALDRTGYATRHRYHLTRLARQKGGFIRPPVQWLCTIAKNFEIVDEPRLGGKVMVPVVAIAEKLLAVENTLYYPGMQAFFFRHSAATIESVTRRFLWPSSQEDELYRRLLLDVGTRAWEYFEREDCTIDDYDKGVIDRGFYTGAEPAARAGFVLYDQQEYAAAIGKYTEALAIDPEDDAILTGRAAAYASADDYTAAAADYERAAHLNPDSAVACSGLGTVRQHAGDLPGAIDAFTAAINRDPDYGTVWLNRSRAFAELGRFADAASDLDEAVRRDFTLKRTVGIDRALLLTAMGNDDAAEAQLRQLDAWEVDTERLRAHIAGMRAKRTSG
jgi:hypothetical protein